VTDELEPHEERPSMPVEEPATPPADDPADPGEVPEDDKGAEA
jgi:hypothetical protein